MVDVAIQIEGISGLTWPRWKRLVAEVERLGFDGLYCCDHFNGPTGTAIEPCLEMTLALTYLADHTARVRFGPLVAPLSFRDPVMLARQAMALDDLSGGRMVLGIGAGWVEDEHVRYGYDFGTPRSRMDRLAEGTELIAQLCRQDEPISFDGQFYHVRNGHLAPRSPKSGGPILMIAGKGLPRVLGLVARFGDVWASSRLRLDEFAERSSALNLLLGRNGRQPDAVKRASMDLVVCWRDEAELERRIGIFRRVLPTLADLPTMELRNTLNSMLGHMIDGTPEAIIDQLRNYAAAGLDELMIDWFDCDDIEGLEVLATEILPHVGSSSARLTATT
jgi:alkanesulfonate monooxygenase SsuD/methylene tetrahydromethanopterin reductase-like flavin-dependent oxidoreductase (luciferase family)